MTKEDLEKYYLETTYSVVINEEQYDIKIDNPLPLILEELLSKEKTAAVLTTWNPRSEILPLLKNYSRNEKLNSILKNYKLFHAMGQGVDSSWSAEESFFIVGIKQSEVDKLAIEFEQYAYVWCESGKTASLVFTDLWQDKA